MKIPNLVKKNIMLNLSYTKLNNLCLDNSFSTICDNRFWFDYANNKYNLLDAYNYNIDYHLEYLIIKKALSSGIKFKNECNKFIICSDKYYYYRLLYLSEYIDIKMNKDIQMNKDYRKLYNQISNNFKYNINLYLDNTHFNIILKLLIDTIGNYQKIFREALTVGNELLLYKLMDTKSPPGNVSYYIPIYSLMGENMASRNYSISSLNKLINYIKNEFPSYYYNVEAATKAEQYNLPILRDLHKNNIFPYKRNIKLMEKIYI